MTNTITKDDFYRIIFTPYIKEKTLDRMENRLENKIEFLVHPKASKIDIRAAVEAFFHVKVEKINTRISKKGKHAIVKLTPEYQADDLAMRMGIFA